MNADYPECYKTLNLARSCDWPQAKDSYRRLVQIWHPDRHNEFRDQYFQSHQNFMRINQAFTELQKFYRDNGRLPLQPETLKEEEFPTAGDDFISLSRRRRKRSPQKKNDYRKSISRLSLFVGLMLFAFLIVNVYKKPTQEQELEININVESRGGNGKMPSSNNVQWNNKPDYDIHRGRLLGTSRTSVGDALDRRLQETRR